MAGAFFAATQEQRVAENTRSSGRAFGSAEGGAIKVVSNWLPSTYANMAVYHGVAGDTVGIPRDSLTNMKGARYAGRVYRLSPSLFLLDVTGSADTSKVGIGGGGRSRIGILSKIKPINFQIGASLTAENGVSLQGNASVDGHDNPPPGWAGCPATNAGVSGVSTSGNVTMGGNGNVSGNPPVTTDTTLHNKFNYLDSLFHTLAANANITTSGGNMKIDPVSTGGVCDKTVNTNWGDGMGTLPVCSGYFPIIYINGNVTLNGDQGQGILLVNGNLSVQGSFQFFGITLVLGSINTAGGGNTDAHFYGAVMARDSAITGNNSLSGNATLLYSNCAILTTLQNTSAVSLMRSRGWIQLF
ncbi:MAG TPA: hypothetical protein VNN08_19180 [Thermoanaerobaculia bacterium]|nr:hypothetical protein [Thermoanaerobaculia bacterium]